MKKAVWLISLISVLLIICLIITQLKPTEVDFAYWMEDTYQIECLDNHCDSFELNLDGKKPVVMQTTRGGYSPGIFVLHLSKLYRNHEDSNYFLEVEVKGYFGKLVLVQERVKNVPRR